MAKLGQGTITKKALNLIAKSQTGTGIQFTRMATGDGVWDEETDFLEVENLKSEKQSFDISSIAVLNKDTVRIRGALRNLGLEDGYFIREIGLYAEDPDDGEILYSIVTAEIPDYFPAYSEDLDHGILIDNETTVSNANSVLQITNPDAVVATAADLNELATRVEVLELGKIKTYGVRFSGSNPKGVRVEDAVGMVANVAVDDEIVINDFDEIFNRPICCGEYDENGIFNVNAYLGEPGFDWNGSNGMVCYEETPFGYKGDLHTYLSITFTPMEGYTLSPRFRNWYTKEYSPVFWSTMKDGKLTSVSGGFPHYGSVNDHMTESRKVHAKAHTETMAARMSDYMLQLVEFATKDLQDIMIGAANMPYGESYKSLATESNANRIVLPTELAENFTIGQTVSLGTSYSAENIAKNRIVTSISYVDAGSSAVNFDGEPVNITDAHYIGSRPWKNGTTNIVKASSGSPVSNTDGKHPCIYRGKVDPWGTGYSAICDMLIEREGSDPYEYIPYLLEDPRKYANGAITEDYKKLNYKMATANGYSKTLGLDKRFPYARLPDEVGASDRTYLAAYYYIASSNIIRVVWAGGALNNGRDCSPVVFNCNNAPSTSDWTRLSRLFVTRD